MQTSSICAPSLVLHEMIEVFFTVANLADVEWVILSHKIMFLQLRDLNYMSQLVPIERKLRSSCVGTWLTH
jgi:hypothetical protein